MSGKYPALNPVQVEAILKKAGFRFLRPKGSHFQWEGFIKGKRRLVTVDHFGGQRSEAFGRRLLESMINQSGLTKDEFYAYHQKK